MFENRRPVYVLVRNQLHYLNTSVFGTPTQTQFPSISFQFISNSVSRLVTSVRCLAVSVLCNLKLIENKFVPIEEGSI